MDTANTGSKQGPLNFDSEFCGRVPLNQTNLVQPHGVLLVVDRSALTILQCSENCAQFFGTDAATLTGTSLTDHIPKQQKDRLLLRLGSGIEGKFPIKLRFDEQDFLFVVEILDDFLLFEAESAAGSDSFLDVYEQIKYVMSAIEQTDTIEAACRLIAKELKTYSGFDKVMIYRFDNDWNGEVIAEEKEDDMESYLGLFFPASDIPKQARELYRKNPYRLIPAIDYTPVKLYPVLNPRTNSFTDLSNSNLRSVAGVHLEYLRNMGVQASMSTRILKAGKLWGLIACHHKTPRYLSYQDCSVFELLSTFITSKIAAVDDAADARRKADGHKAIAFLAEALLVAPDMATGINGQVNTLLELLSADGVALMLNRTIRTWGSVPSNVEIQDLVYWLQTHGVTRLHQENNLASVFEPGQNFADKASGVLVLPLQPDRGQYLLAFRKEAVRRINWGGNPNAAVQFESDGRKYHPRHSFQQWQQTLLQTAPAWTETEEVLAESFRQFLLEYMLSKA